jgi:hypothetical protein
MDYPMHASRGPIFLMRRFGCYKLTLSATPSRQTTIQMP